MDKNNVNLHYPDDGRGRREIYVNGRLVKFCFFADVGKGYADCYRRGPGGRFKLDKHRKRILSRRRHGDIAIRCLGVAE